MVVSRIETTLTRSRRTEADEQRKPMSFYEPMSDKDAEHRSKLRFLLKSAASLASTSVITAGLGFVFWAVAAAVVHRR